MLRKPSQLFAAHEVLHRHLDFHSLPQKWLYKELTVTLAGKHHDTAMANQVRQKVFKYFGRPGPALRHPQGVKRVIIGRDLCRWHN